MNILCPILPKASVLAGALLFGLAHNALAETSSLIEGPVWGDAEFSSTQRSLTRTSGLGSVESISIAMDADGNPQCYLTLTNPSSSAVTSACTQTHIAFNCESDIVYEHVVFGLLDGIKHDSRIGGSLFRRANANGDTVCYYSHASGLRLR